MQIDETLIQLRLINQAGLAAQRWQRRIVRMRRQANARALRNRQHFLEETIESPPELFGGNRREEAGRSHLIVDHIPDHTVWDGCIEWTCHTHRECLSSGERANDPSGDARDAKV